MKNKKIKYAFLNALATALYIALIGSFMYLGNHGFFGEVETIFIPIAMLMLFVFSAALTGFLMFGRPLMWYLDGKKREALSLIAYTLLFFFIFTIIMFSALVFSI